MSELRLNVLTNEWVIIAPGRGERPRDLRRKQPRVAAAAHDPDCPFCPGNEHCSVETARVPDDAGGWRLRVVLNRFPALEQDTPGEGPIGEQVDGLRVRSDAYGVHEVIVDTPRHDLPPALMSHAEFTEVLRAYRSRYQVFSADPRLAHVVVFKNHGSDAGATLRHPHSQLIASPVVSGQVIERLRSFARHRKVHGDCLACGMLADELRDGARILHTGRDFVALTPWAALSPFHMWVIPRRHGRSFSEVTDPELADLAFTLRRVLRMLHFGLGDPDYNYVIRSGPLHDTGEETHWYLSIVPRVSKAAGFEFGSGMYINPTWPEHTAAFLREVVLPPEPQDPSAVDQSSGTLPTKT